LTIACEVFQALVKEATHHFGLTFMPVSTK